MDVRDQPYTDLELIELPDQELAVVTHRAVTLADLPRLFDSAMSPLQAAMESGGFRVAGPFLAVYSGTVSEPFDIAIGFPAEGIALEDDAEVTGHLVPAGLAAVYSHIGRYDDLGEAWQTFMAALERSGRTPSDRFMEVYVSEPGVDPDDQLRTDLVMYLKD